MILSFCLAFFIAWICENAILTYNGVSCNSCQVHPYASHSSESANSSGHSPTPLSMTDSIPISSSNHGLSGLATEGL